MRKSLIILFLIYISMTGCQNTGKNIQANPTYSPAVLSLIQKLGSENINISSKAREDILNLEEEALYPLIDSLKDENPLIRGHAAHILGQGGYEEAVIPLISTLEDKNKIVRLWVIFALGQLKNPKAVDPLILKLRDENKLIRVYSIIALYSIGNDKAMEAIEKALAEEENPFVINVTENILNKDENPEVIDLNLPLNKGFISEK